jgi:hypothetical protein
MSISTNAILFYGYCWDEETSRPWTIRKDDEDESDESEEEEDWEDRYALAKGLASPSEPFPEGTRTRTGQFTFSEEEQKVVDLYSVYWRARNTLVKEAECEVDVHCSLDATMPYVAVCASKITSRRGDMNEVKSLGIGFEWNGKLEDFCSALGIDVSEMKPGWWLVSLWA